MWAILLTVSIYACGLFIFKKTGELTLLQPLVIGIALIILVLVFFNIDYFNYFKASSLIHFLLGTATVALAIPLYNHLDLLRSHRNLILISIFIGSALASISAVGLGWLFGANHEILLSLAPKSITTPFAISVSESIGGIPALTASFVIATGIIVTLIATPLFRIFKVDSPVIRGTIMGITGHGIATANAFTLSPQTGAYSALAMGLNGTWTAIALPYLLHFLS
jgi:predicted murein hydrolase (TIGR00659 family)